MPMPTIDDESKLDGFCQTNDSQEISVTNLREMPALKPTVPAVT